MTWKFEKSVRLKSPKIFANFENSDDSENIKMACETIRDNSNIKAESSTNHSEQKQHNKCFDKKCSILLDQRKYTEL
jgi:hypothetical protein